jgi:serine/threonine-protein kinase
VLAQDPPAGSEAPEGSRVRLNVAQEVAATTTLAPTAPPAPAIVPDVVGEELADAAEDFADEGLKVSVRYVPSEEEQGRVVAQAQPAGTERRRGDSVQLNISMGTPPPEEAVVPDVVRRRLDQARRTLEQAGFEVLAFNLAGEVRNESFVNSQSPSSGGVVPRGSLVILYLG